MHSILEEEGRPLALLPSYLEMIRSSVGSHQYRMLFVKDAYGNAVDVIGDGDLACAFYVSSILSLFNLIKGGVHTTVDMTIADLLDSGWYEVPKLHPGSVIVWAKKLCTDGIQHRHIGFYVDRNQGISNDAEQHSPQSHHYTYGDQGGRPTRRIEALYFHPLLEK